MSQPALRPKRASSKAILAKAMISVGRKHGDLNMVRAGVVLASKSNQQGKDETDAQQ